MSSRILMRVRDALVRITRAVPGRRRLALLDVAVVAAGAGALAAAAVFGVWLLGGATVIVNNARRGEEPIARTLTGRECPDAQRPVAVMLASDPEARPLSGVAAADMVVEMPVTPNGITRMMAVFQCGAPREVGSIRSARMDFIPYIQGLGAIYAHWGGEHEALELLDGGIVDNVDALKFEGTVYYRKQGIPRPHNGFTTLENVRGKALDLGYAASGSAPSYPHTNAEPERNLARIADAVATPWPQGMDVMFRYDAGSNTYLRWRGGEPEIDALDGRQVAVAAVLVVRTSARLNYDQYVSVRVLGEGDATIYQNGRRSEARWKKPTASDMLSFVDDRGDPIPLAPGRLWVLVDAPLE